MNLVFDLMNQPVSELMSTDLKAVVAADSLADVKAIFETYNIHHLPVVRFKTLVGFISKTDLLQTLAQSSDPQTTLNSTSVAEVMTSKIVKLHINDKIGVAAEVFLENRFHAVPILNEQEELVGIVSSYDLIKFFFHHAYPHKPYKKFV